MTRTSFSLALVACAAAAAPLSAQLVGNGGFEFNIAYDSGLVPGNWLAFFGPAGVQEVLVTNVAPASGAQHLTTRLRGAANSYNGVVQRLLDPVVPGGTYELDFVARASGPVLDGAEFRIEWIDAAGGFVNGQFGTNTPVLGLTDFYQHYGLSAVAPAGAINANVVFAIQSFGGGGLDENVFWDDVSLALVPTPASAALLGLGGLFVGRRRR